MSSKRRRGLTSPGTLGVAGLATAAAVVVAVVALGSSGTPGAGASSASGTTALSTAPASTDAGLTGINAAKPLAAWIGDTWISGINAGGLGSGIAAKASTMLGYSWLTASQPETGWASAGLAGVQGLNQPFPDRVAAIVTNKPAMVVIAGGSNDAVRGASAAAVTAGVRETVTLLRASLGQKETIVIVGPTWPSADIPAAVATTSAAVKAEAGALKVPFVDPIGEHWITAANAATYEKDGFLTAEGNTALAALFVSDADRLGIPKAG